MTEPLEVKAGDPCPQCGGAFRVDHTQLPEVKIGQLKRNIQFPDAAARYAERASAKAGEFGLIHVCGTCGYKARFKVDDAPAGDAGDARDQAAAGARQKSKPSKAA